jgi:hypothetical protein
MVAVDSERGTGRTTKMLQEAWHTMLQGENVVVVMAQEVQRNYAFRLLHEVVIPRKLMIENVIEFAVSQWRVRCPALVATDMRFITLAHPHLIYFYGNFQMPGMRSKFFIDHHARDVFMSGKRYQSQRDYNQDMRAK